MEGILLLPRFKLHPVELMISQLPEDNKKAFLRARCYHEWGLGYQPKGIGRDGQVIWHYRPGIIIDDHRRGVSYTVNRDGSLKRLTPKMNKWERKRLQER